ncbi:MAG: hypothetical protein IT236_10495 [Bacteroidia bacterium]|nr:hypothetical protein [Bacteroidia bacterium]
MSFISQGQIYPKKFKALFAAKDTASLRPLLAEWEEANPNDAEMLVAQFNYYVYKSKHERLGPDKAAEEKAKLNHDTAAMHTAHITNIVHFDSVNVRKALWYINFGIKANPNRLDMHFGKVYYLGELKKFDYYAAELMNVVEQSHKNKNAWRWVNNVPNATPFDFMVVNVHHYLAELLLLNDPKKNAHIKSVTQALLKYYPDNVQTLVVLSNVKLEEKQPDNAYLLLKRAETLEPNNSEVCLGLGTYHNQKGNKEKAILYFEKALPGLEEPFKEYVLKELERLKPPVEPR